MLSFFSYKTSYLNEEVNRTGPASSGRVIYAECQKAKCHYLVATMLTVVIPIVIILNVVAPIGNWFVLKILFRGYVGL
jgi:hypothetical protein